MGPLFWSSLVVIAYVGLAGAAGLYMLYALRRQPAEEAEEARYAVFDDPEAVRQWGEEDGDTAGAAAHNGRAH